MAFLAITGHWVLTYVVAETTLAWPLGIAAAVAPIVLGAAVVRWLATTGAHGPDAVRVVRGLLLFFVLLNVVVALNGAYDVLITALLTAYGIRLLRHRYLLTADSTTDPERGASTTPVQSPRSRRPRG